MSLFAGLRAQRLLALLGAASVLLSYPVLDLWGATGSLALVAFGLWLLVIATLGWLVERSPPER
jgi:hypothetical protein